MKKIITFLIGVSSLAPVWANWMKIGTTEAGNIVWYVEPQALQVVNSTIRRSQFLYDDIKAGRSVMMHDEFNCKDNSRRTISAKSYNGLLAKGKIVVSVVEPTKWATISKGSTDQKLIEIACYGYK